MIATIPGKEEGEEQEASFASTLALCKDARIRMLFLGILCIVGIDVGLNTTIPKLLMEKLSMPLQEAGLGVAFILPLVREALSLGLYCWRGSRHDPS